MPGNHKIIDATKKAGEMRKSILADQSQSFEETFMAAQEKQRGGNSTGAYSERIAEQIAARTCRKEQTVEAMKMIPQERVSKRIVKQIMACHKWQEQNVVDSQNHATSCEHEGPIEDCVSRQDPAANR